MSELTANQRIAFLAIQDTFIDETKLFPIGVSDDDKTLILKAYKKPMVKLWTEAGNEVQNYQY